MAKIKRIQPLNTDNQRKTSSAIAADTGGEDAIRHRAYTIWEREGRPHGRHEDHWHQAREELSPATDLQRESESTVMRRRKNK